MAQRYGTTHGLIDIGRGETRSYKELIEEMITLIEPDIEHFACQDEVSRVFAIIENGTSAQKQTRTYDEAIRSGDDSIAALNKVKQFLMTETLRV